MGKVSGFIVAVLIVTTAFLWGYALINGEVSDAADDVEQDLTIVEDQYFDDMMKIETEQGDAEEEPPPSGEEGYAPIIEDDPFKSY
jgi:hypothetical protein